MCRLSLVIERKPSHCYWLRAVGIVIVRVVLVRCYIGVVWLFVRSVRCYCYCYGCGLANYNWWLRCCGYWKQYCCWWLVILRVVGSLVRVQGVFVCHEWIGFSVELYLPACLVYYLITLQLTPSTVLYSSNGNKDGS